MPHDPFYWSKPWCRLRTIVLRDEPLCQECKQAPSTVAAHIHSRRQYPDFELLRQNVRGLCDRCHNSETVRQDRGFGMKPTNRRPGCDESGQPLDPGHHWRTVPLTRPAGGM